MSRVKTTQQAQGLVTEFQSRDWLQDMPAPKLSESEVMRELVSDLDE